MSSGAGHRRTQLIRECQEADTWGFVTLVSHCVYTLKVKKEKRKKECLIHEAIRVDLRNMQGGQTGKSTCCIFHVREMPGIGRPLGADPWGQIPGADPWGQIPGAGRRTGSDYRWAGGILVG